MVIRDRQLLELTNSAQHGFEDRLLLHIQEFFPVHWRVTGPERMRQVVRLGIAKAAGYGLETQREIYLFVSLMLYLGSSFDTDFQLPWAAAGLNNAAEPDTFTRIEATYDAGMQYLDRVAGPDGIHANAALQRFISYVQRPGSAHTETAAQMLPRIYPEKCAELNTMQIERLLEQGRTSGVDPSGANGEAVLLCAALAMLLGHGFADDPQFSWTKDVMSDPAVTDPRQRFELFKQTSAKELRAWIDGGPRAE